MSDGRGGVGGLHGSSSGEFGKFGGFDGRARMTPAAILRARLFALLALLWVGSQLTIGYAVAPVLFSSFPPMTAGGIAAQLFRIEGFLGLLCGASMIVLCNQLARRGHLAYRRLRWLVVGMLVCVLVGYFAVQPSMNAIRIAVTQAGTDIAHSPDARRFGLLHGLSSAFYLVQSLLGVALVWFSAAPARGRE